MLTMSPNDSSFRLLVVDHTIYNCVILIVMKSIINKEISKTIEFHK